MATPPPPQKDTCPAWASALIARICETEIRLGNIKPGDEWQVSMVSDLAKVLEHSRVDGLDGDDSSLVDAIFLQLCRGLTNERYTSEQIAAFINSRIPTGTRLSYCNAEEVEDALRGGG